MTSTSATTSSYPFQYQYSCSQYLQWQWLQLSMNGCSPNAVCHRQRTPTIRSAWKTCMWVPVHVSRFLRNPCKCVRIPSWAQRYTYTPTCPLKQRTIYNVFMLQHLKCSGNNNNIQQASHPVSQTQRLESTCSANTVNYISLQCQDPLPSTPWSSQRRGGGKRDFKIFFVAFV